MKAPNPANGTISLKSVLFATDFQSSADARGAASRHSSATESTAAMGFVLIEYLDDMAVGLASQTWRDLSIASVKVRA